MCLSSKLSRIKHLDCEWQLPYQIMVINNSAPEGMSCDLQGGCEKPVVAEGQGCHWQREFCPLCLQHTLPLSRQSLVPFSFRVTS